MTPEQLESRGPEAAARIGRGRPLTSAEIAGIVALVVVVALIPLVWSNAYALGVMITAMIVLVLNISWNFVLGVAGVWNFGQLAIYAIGGYGTGLLMLHTPLPPVLAIVCGGLLAAGMSVLLAFPTLRLHGIYTSLLTFSFAQVFLFVVVNDPAGLTGGTFGFPTVPGLFSFLSPTASLHAYFWTMLAVVIVATLAVARIRGSRLGIALRTIRDAPSYAAARGISPLKYRVIAFAISGFIAGVAGGLYMSYNQSFTTAAMGLTPMSIDVTMLVIGGLGTIWGPILGTSVLTGLQVSLVDYPGIQLTILGAILLVIVVFVPGGIVGLLASIRHRISAWVAEEEGEGEGDRPPEEEPVAAREEREALSAEAPTPRVPLEGS
ncbi:MAG: branched-chain amino acid ABC transporter permease [Actinomycetota bacterium]